MPRDAFMFDVNGWMNELIWQIECSMYRISWWAVTKKNMAEEVFCVWYAIREYYVNYKRGVGEHPAFVLL